jgi:hypothetical protein
MDFAYSVPARFLVLVSRVEEREHSSRPGKSNEHRNQSR